MKKALVIIGVLGLVLTFSSQVMAAGVKNSNCATIQSGELVDSSGNVIETGYDVWGYNYQAHMFNGFYDNSSRPATPVTEGDNLEMKWNDAWLSNKDCDADGKLDRYLGYDSYIGSGAWEMYSEKMGGADGYTYKCKIIAVPTDAYNESGIWYNADGTEIGPVIWTDFAIIQEVQGGNGINEHGLLYKGLDHTGLGGW